MAVDTKDIQITPASEEPGAKTLRVEVPVERVRAAEQTAASHYAKQARLRGFRKGKAPLSVVRKQYREAIRERAIRDLIGDSWTAALERQELKPIADPRVRDLTFSEDAPMTFELVVEVKPELTLNRIGGFKLVRHEPAVSSDAVGEQLDELRRQKATWVPVDAQTPSEGQLAAVTVQTLEGDTASEPKPYQVVIGSGQAIPDLEQLIMTLAPGETKEAPVRYPDDFPDETKRGQSRVVRVSLQDIKRQELPALDDALARELGDFESLDDLRKAVQTDLEAHAQREADAEVRRQVIEEIASANDLQAPPTMVQRLMGAYAQSYGIPDDQLDQFATEFRPLAERQVVRELIIDHVAERDGFAATEAELDQRIEELAQRRGTEPAKLYASLQKSNQLRELERGITEEKVFRYLLEQSDTVSG
jgi:trigger factor